jgi:hypothetical protein
VPDGWGASFPDGGSSWIKFSLFVTRDSELEQMISTHEELMIARHTHRLLN